MFTNNYNKSTFGTPTSSAFGFGNAVPVSTTPFGQTQQFGNTTTTSAFGSSAPLFGSAPQPNTAPLFSNSAFGATQSPGYGAGLFGQQQTSSANALFSNSAVPSFGQQNKTSAFGFGSSAPSTLFGQQQSQPYQTQNTSGAFGSTPSFGGTQKGTVTKFNSVTGTDTMQKGGITHTINTKHHCITCMKDYENKSLEELRWEDYECNRKGPQQQSSFGASPFATPGPAASVPMFGQTENKSAFPQPATSFGTAPAAFAAQQSLFGKSTGAFGATTTTPASNSFGFNSNTSFGANTPVKSFGLPAAQNLFSTPATQQSAFGTNLFTPTTAQSNPSGMFAANTSSFGTQPSLAFPQTNSFQTPKTTPAFGSNFAQPTQTPNMFSQVPSNPFTSLQKPATQPLFGQSQLGLMGTQSVNTNSFMGNANKPLFTNPTGSYFGNNTGFMSTQQQPVAPTQFPGLESQAQMPDFNKTVEQIYDFFPRQNFLLDLATTHDTTNPIDIKDILESESPLTMSIKSRLRIIPKSTNFVSSINYQKQILLKDLEDKQNMSSELLKNGRRLNLRKKTTQKSNETSVDCFLSILDNSKAKEFSQLETTGNNMFKNIQTLQDNQEPDNSYEAPRYCSTKLNILDMPSDKTCEEEYLRELNVLRHRVKTLNHSASQNEADDLSKKINQVQSQDKSFQGTPERLPRKGSPKVLSLSPTLVTNFGSPNSSTSDVMSPEGRSILNKSGKSKNAKTVRFIDDGNNSDILSTSTPARSIYTTHSRLSDDRDMIDIAINTEVPHPCGIKLTRQEYYTLPPFEELSKFTDENGACLIRGFTIGRTGYGNIYFPDQIDISNMDLDEIIHFCYREVQVYPSEENKPAVGHGLNRRAQVTLDHIWPKGYQAGKSDSLDCSAITHLIDRLCILSEKQNAKFLDYRPETGSWVFNVEHFSKYTYWEEGQDIVAPKTTDFFVDDSAFVQKKETPCRSDQLSGYAQIKTEEEIKFFLEDLHHSIDIKEETSNLVSRLDKKLKSETSKQFLRCKLCSHKCVSKSKLKDHLRSHTGEKPFSCEICEFKCSLKSNLQVHLRMHANEKPFICYVCGYQCAQKYRLIHHFRIHTGEKPFSCEICGHKLARKDDMKRHLQTHTGEKPFSCDKCEYKCARLSTLKKHLRTHTGEKPLKCEVCDYKCKETSQLKNHLRIHTGEKSFQCEICNYKSLRKGDLKIHEAIHTGQKSFTCQVCDYKCSRRGTLRYHNKSVHADYKPISCAICNYRCTIKSVLTRHLVKHTGEKLFTCEICDHRSARKGDLRKHILTHTGEKRFSCKICNSKFAQKESVNRHFKIHTGQKPFTCEVCDYKCAYANVLKKHLKTHTEGK